MRLERLEVEKEKEVKEGIRQRERERDLSEGKSAYTQLHKHHAVY
jgi:hypothetical protein